MQPWLTVRRWGFGFAWLQGEHNSGRLSTTDPQVIHMPRIVPRVPTPTTFEALPEVVALGFRAIEHRITPLQRLNLAVLAAIETARGRSRFNFNLGNISASSRFIGDAWRPPWFEPPTETTSERNRILHEAMKRGEAPSAFRAYPTEEEGSADFARQIVRTYPEVLHAADQTDANTLRLAISQKYSKDFDRGNRAEVTRTLQALQREYGLRAATTGEGAALVALLVLWGLSRRR